MLFLALRIHFKSIDINEKSLIYLIYKIFNKRAFFLKKIGIHPRFKYLFNKLQSNAYLNLILFLDIKKLYLKIYFYFLILFFSIYNKNNKKISKSYIFLYIIRKYTSLSLIINNKYEDH